MANIYCYVARKTANEMVRFHDSIRSRARQNPKMYALTALLY